MSGVIRGQESSATEVALPLRDRVVLIVGGLALGVILAWALPLLTGLAASWEWFPFRDPLRLVGRLSSEHAAVPVVLWIVVPLAGAAVGGLLIGRAATIVVGDGEIIVHSDGGRTRVARAQVNRILLQGRELTVRDDRDVDLLTAKLDVPPGQVATALAAHGWTVERA